MLPPPKNSNIIYFYPMRLMCSTSTTYFFKSIYPYIKEKETGIHRLRVTERKGAIKITISLCRKRNWPAEKIQSTQCHNETVTESRQTPRLLTSGKVFLSTKITGKLYIKWVWGNIIKYTPSCRSTHFCVYISLHKCLLNLMDYQYCKNKFYELA